jgi:hypothetical protein
LIAEPVLAEMLLDRAAPDMARDGAPPLRLGSLLAFLALVGSFVLSLTGDFTSDSGFALGGSDFSISGGACWCSTHAGSSETSG